MIERMVWKKKLEKKIPCMVSLCHHEVQLILSSRVPLQWLSVEDTCYAVVLRRLSLPNGEALCARREQTAGLLMR